MKEQEHELAYELIAKLYTGKSFPLQVFDKHFDNYWFYEYDDSINPFGFLFSPIKEIEIGGEVLLTIYTKYSDDIFKEDLSNNCYNFIIDLLNLTEKNFNENISSELQQISILQDSSILTLYYGKSCNWAAYGSRFDTYCILGVNKSLQKKLSYLFENENLIEINDWLDSSKDAIIRSFDEEYYIKLINNYSRSR
jgi:hypothetical protein